jgi:mono/diheme cytochrome c family protein
MQKYLIFLVFSTILFFILSFNSSPVRSTTHSLTDLVLPIDTIIWVAPDSVNNLVNPTESDEESLLDGKMIYNKNCRSCHGKLGDGTGSGGKELETKPTDFTNPEFLDQTDGSMFWKTSEGRDDMKTFKEKLSEEDIWLVVNYIKKFASDNK